MRSLTTEREREVQIMGRCEHYRPITAADVIRARKRGRALGIQQAIKSWLGFRKNAIPNMRKAYMIGEVIKTFGIDEDLATKIVNEFFDENFNN